MFRARTCLRLALGRAGGATPRFPLGVDLVLVAGGRIAALPRSTRVERGLMYVAVKGGERAIDNAHRWLAEERRGDPAVPELDAGADPRAAGLAVDRVMNEGSCYDRDLAALAIKQARGDLVEAAFLLRAYRTTLPRFGCQRAASTPRRCASRRRISATYKDLPGGQVLGPTFDYTHRLLDFALLAGGEPPRRARAAAGRRRADAARHSTLLDARRA